MQRYQRVEYGGYTFGTKQSQMNNKHDSSHLRVDYNEPVGRHNSRPATAYATITDLFVHTMYPGGPSKVVVGGSWLEVMGKCPIAGTTLVRKNRTTPSICTLSSHSFRSVTRCLWRWGHTIPS